MPGMDRLIIRNLELYASIGVTAAEREVGQRLLVNVEASYELQEAGRSDDLAHTVSYAELARTVVEVAATSEYQLLEALAEAMAAAMLERFPVTEVRLQLLKRPPPLPIIMEAAGVEIVRRHA
ncbi:MAG TPA: dihydroneopterin aldolase [Ardenticatenaceae bacterium]